MIHPGLAALKYWDREKYAAGYCARFAEIPDSETAHRCWRCGWEDADTEALDLPAIRGFLPKVGETTSKTPGAIFSTLAKRREPTYSVR